MKYGAYAVIYTVHSAQVAALDLLPNMSNNKVKSEHSYVSLLLASGCLYLRAL